ncbi:MAG: hypothetical protein ACTHXA_11690 [Gulosibacter sp.]|uniref:hypothetical protein n=1 Tax=Gulosibacter sp. TaxID=2817531 RepID=UPI003F909934
MTNDPNNPQQPGFPEQSGQSWQSGSQGGDQYGAESGGGAYGSGTYGQGSYGQDASGQGVYGQDTSGQSSYGQGNQSQSNYGQGDQGEGNYGQGTNGQGSQGQGSQGQGTYGQGTYGQGTYGQQAEAQGAYNQGPYNQGTYGQSHPDQGQSGQGETNQGQPSQGQYGQPPTATYGQGYAPGGQPPQKKSGRKKWWIIGVVGVVVIGLLAWGGIALFGKFGGANSPEAAVENYLTSAASFNIIDTALSTAPSERAIIQDAAMQLRDADLGKSSGDEDSEIPSIFESLEDLEAAIDVSRDNFEYETEEIVEGVEVVTITEGVITFDGDEEAFKEAMVNLARGLRYEAEVSSGMSEEEALELAFEVTDEDLDVEFPYEYDLVNGGDDMEPLPDWFGIVTVKEGNGWYISQFMTGAHFAAAAFANGMGTGTVDVNIGDEVLESAPADSPEAAGLQFTEGLMEFVSLVNGQTDVDVELGVSTLTEAERTLVSLFLLPIVDEMSGGSSGPAWGEFEFEISGGFEEFEYGGKTMILPDGLQLSVEGDDSVELDGYCASIMGEEPACLTDWAPYSELGFDELGLVVVQEDGGWLVSPYQTVEIFLETATERYLELREEGNLDVLYG